MIRIFGYFAMAMFFAVEIQVIRGADQPKLAQPQPAYDFPKGDAAWEVNIEMTAVTQAATTPEQGKHTNTVASRGMKKVDILRKGNIRRDTITWSDNNTTVSWWTVDPELTFIQDPMTGSVIVRKSGDEMEQRYDESMVDWVSDGNLIGEQPFRGKKCRYHKLIVTNTDGSKVTWQCWIDGETSRPAAVSKGPGVLVLFTFDLPVPDAPLILPPKFQSQFNRIKNLL